MGKIMILLLKFWYYNHIINSTIEINKKSTKNRYRQDFKKTIKMRFEENDPIKSEDLEYVVNKMLLLIKNMQIYCLNCRKHSNNISSKT